MYESVLPHYIIAACAFLKVWYKKWIGWANIFSVPLLMPLVIYKDSPCYRSNNLQQKIHNAFEMIYAAPRIFQLVRSSLFSLAVTCTEVKVENPGYFPLQEVVTQKQSNRGQAPKFSCTAV